MCKKDKDICCQCNKDCTDEAIKHELEIYCQDCYDNKFICCDCCGDIVLRNSIWWAENDDAICEDCYDDNYFTCDCCRNVIHNDYYACDGYCESCNDERCDDGDGLFDYGYKPRPTFYDMRKGKAKRFYGIELEMEGSKDGNNDYVDKHWYFKSDGSLDYGQELVTHPFSWEYYMHKLSRLFRKTLKEMFQKGLRSYNNSCGMHIHVSRPSDLQIAKICKLVYGNPSVFAEISERRGTKLQEWAPIDTVCQYPKYVKNKGNYRRNAVNLQPTKTIEFRIFRGTLRYERFLKNLLTVVSIMDYTDNVGYSQVSLCDWLDYCRKHKKFKKMIEYFETHYTFCKKEEVVNEAV